jgi:hypothetical protein
LPKLEKMGLITKTIHNPFMIEAIPVEKALDSLVSRERKKSIDTQQKTETGYPCMLDKRPEHN